MAHKKYNQIVTIVLTALIVGFGTYFWQESRPNSSLNNDYAKIAAYNCEQSGGEFKNDKCDCGAVIEGNGFYQESTGYCITEFGLPGGLLGEEATKRYDNLIKADSK